MADVEGSPRDEKPFEAPHDSATDGAVEAMPGGKLDGAEPGADVAHRDLAAVEVHAEDLRRLRNEHFARQDPQKQAMHAAKLGDRILASDAIRKLDARFVAGSIHRRVKRAVPFDGVPTV